MTEYYIVVTKDNQIIEVQETGNYFYTEDYNEAKKLAELLNCEVHSVTYLPKKKQPKNKTWKDYIK